MGNPVTIVVIEDEKSIQRFLAVSLTGNGFTVFEAYTGREGISSTASHQPDLVILDLGLPDIDGMEVLKSIREWSKVPVLVLSAKGQEEDKVAALDAGADDYLTKPFGVPELLARVRVCLRHSVQSSSGQAEPVFVSGGISVDLSLRQVFRDGVEVKLTPIEYKLLSALVKNAGKVITHKQLLVEVWGPHAFDQTQYLRVYMGHLRHKLEIDPARPEIIITEPGVGYRFLLKKA